MAHPQATALKVQPNRAAEPCFFWRPGPLVEIGDDAKAFIFDEPSSAESPHRHLCDRAAPRAVRLIPLSGESVGPIRRIIANVRATKCFPDLPTIKSRKPGVASGRTSRKADGSDDKRGRKKSVSRFAGSSHVPIPPERLDRQRHQPRCHQIEPQRRDRRPAERIVAEARLHRVSHRAHDP